MMIDITKEIPKSNYKTGNWKKRGVVLHITGDSGNAAINCFKDPKEKKSSNFVIDREGIVYKCVMEENAAFHAGIIQKPTAKIYDGTNPNYYMVGIECVAKAGEPLTGNQKSALIQLICDVSLTNNFEINRITVIGHNELDTVNRNFDPISSFSVDEIVTMCQREMEIREIEQNWAATVKKLEEMEMINSPTYWMNCQDVWVKKLIEKLVNR